MTDEGQTDPLTGFLLARIGEDKAVARAAGACEIRGCSIDHGWYRRGEAEARLEDRDSATHVMAWSPARVLAEYEAKRRIIADHFITDAGPDISGPVGFGCLTCHWSDSWSQLAGEGYCDTIRALAIPYASHPDYQQEWAL